MYLSLWSYENPAFIGLVDVAVSLANARVVLVSPRGDSYVNVLLSMFKRFLPFEPVCLCPLDKKEISLGVGRKIEAAILQASQPSRFNSSQHGRPEMVIVVNGCAAEIIQADLVAAAHKAQASLNLPAVIPLPVRSFAEGETEGADRLMRQLVERFAQEQPHSPEPSVNIIGPSYLGFHDDSHVEEMVALLEHLGVKVNTIFPWKADLSAIARLPRAWANVTWQQERCMETLTYLHSAFNQLWVRSIPIGEKGVEGFIEELKQVLKGALDGGHSAFPEGRPHMNLASYRGRVAQFARSINAEQMRRKRAFVFGSYSLAVGVARFLHHELKFPVACAGTFHKKFEPEFRSQLKDIVGDVFASTDYVDIKKRIEQAEPDLILATQTERHAGAALGIPCVVISPPIHLENFPLSFKPVIGWRGAAYLADLISTPLNLGLEDNLKKMFAEQEQTQAPIIAHEESSVGATHELPLHLSIRWEESALKELKKVPFFVRPKVKRAIEDYALRQNRSQITVPLMYEAREALGG